MSAPWPAAYAPGTSCEIRLSDGSRHAGTVVAVVDGDWIVLDKGRGPVHVARAHIMTVTGRHPGVGGGDGREGRIAPPDAFTDVEIRHLVEAFLDDRPDADLARETGHTRAAIGRLRKAFECARGNLVEDQIPPGARALIDRVRTVLTG